MESSSSRGAQGGEEKKKKIRGQKVRVCVLGDESSDLLLVCVCTSVTFFWVRQDAHFSCNVRVKTQHCGSSFRAPRRMETRGGGDARGPEEENGGREAARGKWPRGETRQHLLLLLLHTKAKQEVKLAGGHRRASPARINQRARRI